MGRIFSRAAILTALSGTFVLILAAASPTSFFAATKKAPKAAAQKQSKPKLKLQDADAIVSGKAPNRVEDLHSTPAPNFTPSKPLRTKGQPILKNVHGEVDGGRTAGALTGTTASAAAGASTKHGKLHIFVSTDQTNTSH